MAYLALYRLFRPSSFSGLIGQTHIVKILTNQIETGKVGHAYLFCGPRGTGKTSVAKIFARAVNCEHPVGGSACGMCDTCRALADPSSLDIVEIDAASNNGVNEMRDLREKVQYPPVNGKYKVYIVDEVHMLSDSAFNALLKTLEEPPRHAIFILATTEPHKLPATILSRCMRFDFRLLSREELEGLLRQVLEKIGKEYEEEAISAIARAGAGSARDMLSIADTCVSYDGGKLTYDAVEAVLGNADIEEIAALAEAMLLGKSEALTLAEKMLASGKDVGVLCKDMLQFLNRLAIAKLCRGAKELIGLPDDLFEIVDGVAKKADGHRVLRATELFAATEGKLRYASSPRILFETAVIKTAMPSADTDAEALMARMAALEQKCGTNAGGDYAALLARVEALEEKAAKGGIVPLQTERRGAESEERGATESAVRDRHPAQSVRAKTEESPGRETFDFPEPPAEEFFATGGAEETVGRPDFSQTRRTERAKEPAAVIKRTGEAQPADGARNNVFGRFLRTLRRLNRGGAGVLITMCTEFDASFDGDTFVLSTDKEMVYAAATSESGRATIDEALRSLGVTDYRIDFLGTRETTDGLAAFERDFSDQTIIKK